STEGPSSPVPDDLLRLSIGIESPTDLIADLALALEAVTESSVVATPVLVPTAQLSAPDNAEMDSRKLPLPLESSGLPAKAPRGEGRQSSEVQNDGATSLTERVRAALERSIVPTIIARGGALRLLSVEDGVVTLEASGSPGAIVPAASRIEAQLRAAVPEI